jgi:cobalt-zinc-cadmium efflux system membrane fusion protein
MKIFRNAKHLFLISTLLIYIFSFSACENHDNHEHTIHEEKKTDEHDEHDHSAHQTESVHDDEDEQEHSEHNHSEEEDVGIELSEKQIKESGIKIEPVKTKKIHKEISLLGDITVNKDMTACVVSRVPGNVKKVLKTLGDKVKKGEVLAEIDSRELADTKANYLAALEKYNLEKTVFVQEEEIYKKKISSEREYLNAKQSMADARIELRSAKQKLVSLGISKEKIAKLPEMPDETLTHFEIKAPFDGTIIEKHITQGEVIKEDKEDDVNFVIANLDTVWANLRICQKDLPLIRTGQQATISVGYGVPDSKGTIDFVSPVLGEETRTALGRLVIDNKSGLYRPGLFVAAKVVIENSHPKICVPVSAVQNIDGENIVFIQHEDENEFEPQTVKLGVTDGEYVEIISGLKSNDKYVSEGSFELKTKIITGGMDAHAGHGH